MLLSRRVPRWLQVTIRFLEIDEGGAGAEVSAAERGEKEESGEGEPRVSTRLGSPSASAGISPLYEL